MCRHYVYIQCFRQHMYRRALIFSAILGWIMHGKNTHNVRSQIEQVKDIKIWMWRPYYHDYWIFNQLSRHLYTKHKRRCIYFLSSRLRLLRVGLRRQTLNFGWAKEEHFLFFQQFSLIFPQFVSISQVSQFGPLGASRWATRPTWKVMRTDSIRPISLSFVCGNLLPLLAYIASIATFSITFIHPTSTRCI